MAEVLSFDKRASSIHEQLTKNGGKAPSASAPTVTGLMSLNQMQQSVLNDMQEAVRQVEILRKGSTKHKAVDMSFGEFALDKWGFALDEAGNPRSLYDCLGINPSINSIDNLWTLPDFNAGYRWLVPEIIREAIRTGLRRAPLYKGLIAGEETISQMSMTMPSVNMSEATPKKIGEAESIPMGNMSFEQKQVQANKLAIGIKITDEVLRFSSIAVLSIFLADMGVKLGMALTSEAIDTLVNGDQADGSDALTVIGVQTVGQFKYRDLLRAWIRMGTMGRLPSGILSNEEPALDILELPEFKGLAGLATKQKIEIQTPVPASQAYWVHGAMASNNQIMLIDTTSALIKLNAMPLMIETDRIVDRQINGTYASLATGFATLFNDARLGIDKSIDFAAQGFPAKFDPYSYENISFK